MTEIERISPGHQTQFQWASQFSDQTRSSPKSEYAILYLYVFYDFL